MSLPVISILLEALSEASKHWRALTWSLILPSAALALFELEPGRLSDFSIVWALLRIPIIALFMVSCHRIVLLGPKSLPNRLGLYWTKRETNFLGWLIAVILIPIPFILVIMGVSSRALGLTGTGGWILQLAAIVPALYLVSRASMILPASAADHQPQPRPTWALSHGNGWRLTIALFAFPLLALLLRRSLESVLNMGQGGAAGFVAALFFYLLLSLQVVALSVAFRRLRSAEDETG